MLVVDTRIKRLLAERDRRQALAERAETLRRRGLGAGKAVEPPVPTPGQVPAPAGGTP
jgi:hypothetical protein